MADGLPVNFAIPGESAVASYNWSDLQGGVAYITFNGSRALSSTAEDNILSTSTLDSQSTATSQKAGNATPNYWDFKSNELTTPMIIAASKVILRFKWNFARTGMAGSGSGTLKAKLIRLRGASETDITDEVTTQSSGDVANGSNTSKTSVLSLAASNTALAIGDIIVLRITMVFTESYHYAYVFCDPLSATDYFKLDIPFEVTL